MIWAGVGEQRYYPGGFPLNCRCVPYAEAPVMSLSDIEEFWASFDDEPTQPNATPAPPPVPNPAWAATCVSCGDAVHYCRQIGGCPPPPSWRYAKTEELNICPRCEDFVAYCLCR